LKSLVFGNGQTYARTYDLDGRMTSYTLNGQVQTVSYDAASRITGVTDGGNRANNRTYGYDELDRLTSEQRAQRSLGYSYDAVGNRTQYVNGASVTNYIYGTTSNRLTQLTGSQNTSIATDGNGSITNNGSAAFNYDARGRMVSANTAIGMVTYKINALGQRVLKTTPTSSTVYHSDQSGKLIAESTGSALTEYVFLNDVPIAVTATAALSIGEAAAYFLHTDQLNTPRIITNVDGAIVWQWDSDPFGKDAANASQSELVFNQRFPGQQFDRESNLHYNFFRDYDPVLGRYIQSDPIGLKGGMNTYSYVAGKPLTTTDPLGLEPSREYPARRFRTCTPPEENACTQQCSPDPVESCVVPQTFKIQSMSGGLTGRGWVDGPMSCSCQRPEKSFCERNPGTCTTGLCLLVVGGLAIAPEITIPALTVGAAATK